MSEPQHLRCPYCGGSLSVEYGWEGRPYLQERVVDGFECDDFRACGATWDANGEAVQIP